jgi:hypothetical protein
MGGGGWEGGQGWRDSAWMINQLVGPDEGSREKKDEGVWEKRVY